MGRTRLTRPLTIAAAAVAIGALAVQYTPAMAAGASTRPNAAAKGKPKLPLIRHVFVIMLENEDFSATFGSPPLTPISPRRSPAKAHC